ncbi:endonuclease I [Megasphaera massiliensis]|uniref:endonuclease I n=1 Tax=Megasphaera massiliensis TaxID=1232428 RepID=UPI0036F1E8FC
MTRRSYCNGGVYSYKPPKKKSHFEDSISAQLRSLKSAGHYEKYTITYTKPETNHSYTPDFVLSNGIVIEAKGLFEREDRQKHLLIKEQYPNLDLRFVFQNPKLKLYKGSKTTYGDWADKHGFLWSTRIIPDSWFRESKKDMKGLIPKK